MTAAVRLLERLGPVGRPRGRLDRTRAALAKGELRVGFLGGSITDQKTGRRWPEPFLAWLGDQYPGARIVVENAAIGATGSDLAAFRAGPTVLREGCDLVFVDYAVNDFGQPPARRGRSREGVLRQLLRSGCDVVLVHPFCPEMRADMEAGRVPASVAEFERLASHYGISSVWVGLQGLREVRRGALTWEEWLPDNLHPEERGSRCYADAVIAFLAPLLSGDVSRAAVRVRLPRPRDAACWEHTTIVPLDAAECAGPWTLRNWTTCPGLDRVLLARRAGASLRLSFRGRCLLVGFDFGCLSGEVRWRVDQGRWRETRRDRPEWAGDAGWLRPLLAADNLAPGRHVLELEARRAADGGVVTAIGFFGVIR